MVKIAYIGAGSQNYSTRLLTDILTYPALQKDTFIHLMDINEERLQSTYKSLEIYINEHKNMFSGVKIDATSDMKKALTDAKYVISTFLVDGPEIWQYDIDIPYKYGVSQCLGDNLGPGGIFRFLRSVPVFQEIIKDMKDVGYNCGDRAGDQPLLLNYVDPIAMNTWYCNTRLPDSTIGLDNGVQTTANRIRGWIGVTAEEFSYFSAGLSHLSWFLKILYKDYEKGKGEWKDAYPLIWKRLQADPSLITADKLRIDMMKASGFYMTESSGQLSEYVPYYRKRPDILTKFAEDTTSSSNLKHGWAKQNYLNSLQKGSDRSKSSDDQHISLKTTVSQEYVGGIINAMETNKPYLFHGSVENKNGAIITNFPLNSCVAVPITADYTGLHPQGGIELPPICQGLCMSNIMVQQAAVLGALRKDRELIYHALILDPNTASVSCPEEIRAMVDEMFTAQKKWLSWFEK